MPLNGANVIYIGDLPPKHGGTTVFGMQLVRGLTRAGRAVHAISAITADTPLEDRFEQNHPDIPVDRYLVPYYEPNIRNPSEPAHLATQTRNVTRALTSCLTKQDPDAIVIGHPVYARGVADIARAHGKPTVIVAHGAIDCASVGGYREDLTAEMLAECGRAALVIVVAEYLRPKFHDLGLTNVVAVPNAIDCEMFSPVADADAERLRGTLGAGADDIVVMHPSTLKNTKRPMDVVESACRALAKAPTLHYVIVGNGPHQERVRHVCRERGIDDRVHFAGQVAHRAMPTFYRAADIVLLPSAVEGLAYTYLEAMASGCVLLTSDLPAAREVVEHGKTGFLFPVGDVAAIAELTVRLAEDTSLRRQVGEAAQLGMRNRPNVHQTVDTYATLIDDVAGPT